MKWKRIQGDSEKGKAVSNLGYRMLWAKSEHGIFYNAWTPTPNSRSLSAGYDKAQVLAACDRHAETWSKTA